MASLFSLFFNIFNKVKLGGFIFHMRKLYFLLFFIVIFCFSANAQKEANYWFFGRKAGVNFNPSPPVSVATGQLSTLEGCSTISDASGNLLFYTDGITVWNKNNLVMTNGNNLRGDPSSTQSGVIVPKPGSSTRYYIFTVDMQGGMALFVGGDNDGISSGFCYSEVDMTASGGLGAVVAATKNTALTKPTTEGLAAVQDANGVDYWVVVHGINNNKYMSYHITAAGVNPVPVVSNVGPNVTCTAAQSGAGALGYMKISPNGKKIAACHDIENNQVVISDFNSATGVVSNSTTYSVFTDPNSEGPYGCEFSQCAEYLYVAESIIDFDNFWLTVWPRQTKIWRWDLSTMTVSLFTTINQQENGALQLASDGKMYVASRVRTGGSAVNYSFGQGRYLHAINNPRTAGATLTMNAIDLGSAKCEYGLPPFIASFFYNTNFSQTNIATGDTAIFCVGDSVQFLGSTTVYDSLRWYFGDASTGIKNTSTLLNPKHLFSGSGSYHIQLYKYMCGIKDSAVKDITITLYPVINNLVDQTICSGSNLVLNGTSAPVTSYLWSTGATTPTITVSAAGKYVLTATNSGCISKDSMTLSLSAPVASSVTIAASTNPICAGTSVTFTATPAVGIVGPTYQWYLNGVATGSNSATYTNAALNNGDQIKVVMTGGAACISGSPATSNTVAMTVNPKPTVNVNSPTICAGNTATLTATGATTYTWTGGLPNGSPVTTPVLNSNTSYTVTGTSAGCSNTATANITVNPKPTINVNSPTICAGNTTTLTATGGTSYTWTGGLPNGSPVTTPVLNTNTSYTVTGTDVNGCSNTAVSNITVNPKPTVGVNSPTICSGTSTTLTATGATTYTWTGGLPNGSPVTTPVLNSNTSYTVTGTDASGCSNTAVANITVNPKPTVGVNSPTICTGTSTTLTATGATTYTWTGGLPNGSPVTTPVLNSNTSYTVTGTDGNGCTNTAVANITVNPLPTVGVNSPTICAGTSTTLTATGGTSYTWTGGLPNGSPVTTPILNSNTSYTVTGTDANGCQNTAVASITVTPMPTVLVNSPTICAGSTTTLTATGATTYTWTGGLPNGSPVTTPVLNSNTSYTVTGSIGTCSNTAVANITVNPKPTVNVNSPTICSGNSTTLTATGATTYTWTGGLPNGSPVTTPVLNSNTSYTVTGTDGNGCSNTAVANITVNPSPTVNVNSPTICSGNSTSLTATGASTYTWTGGLPNGSPVTTPVLNSSTSYTVTGTDVNGCSNTAVASVTVNTTPVINVNSPGICAGTTASLAATGATTYTWSGGLPNGANVTTPVLNSNTSYTVIGTSTGCSDTAVSNITVTPKPTVNVNSPTICSGNSTTLTATGATTYTWTGGLPNGSPVTTPVLNSSTSYTVTGSDVNGCSNTAVANITVNPSPTVNVNSPTICSGNSTSLTATGASTYTWTGGLPNGATVTTPVLNSSTSYTVTGTDVNGCSNTAVASVTVNNTPVINVNSPTICAGSTASLAATGATTYTWSGGLPNGANVTTPVLNSNTSYTVIGTSTGCSDTAVSNITVNPKPTVNVNSPTICAGGTTTLTATGASTYTWTGGLPNGSPVTTPVLNSSTSYTVTGTDVNGCSNTAVSNVTVNPKPTVGVNSPTICSGNSTTLTATGASTYTWTGGLPNGSPVTTPVLNSNTSYTVTGTDVNGCSNTAVSSITVNPLPTVGVNSPAICSGNSTTLTATGASTYTWTGGLPNGSPVTTPVLNSNTSYIVTGTDVNGCSNTAVSTVTVNPKPTVNVNSPTICSGQTATLTATGASTYTWTGGLPNGATVTTPVLNSNTSYTVTGTDGNGCVNTAVSNITVTASPNVTVNSPTICNGQNTTLTANGANSYTWSTGATGPSITVAPGSTTSYSVTGTLAGCPLTSSATSTVTVNPLPTVGVNSPAICTGNSTTLTATGATTYTWTGGLPNGATVTTPILNSNTSYTVTGTDANGCVNTATSNVTVNPKPTVGVNSPTICSGSTTTLTATGASTYTWTGGLPNGSPVTTPVLNSNTSYTVTGTDGNGCVNTAVANVTVNPKPTVGVNSPTICAGNSTTLTATGASTYTWTGGLANGSPVTTPVLNSNTSYTVTGTDANGCSNTAVSNVTVNPKPTVNVNSPSICSGNTAGLTATGASTYSWTGGLPNGASVTTPVLTSTTSYTVTGTDVNGCSNTAVSTITVNPLPPVAVNSPTICSGQSATLTATGASTYTWTGGLPNGSPVTTPVLNSNTSYTVTGTDANGCVNTAISNITVTASPNVAVNSPTICNGQNTTLTATGANTYTWSTGASGPSITVAPGSTTSYSVTGLLAGCPVSSSATSTVTVNPLPTVGVNSPAICSGGTATLNASGATTYTWTGGLPNGSSVTTPPLNSNTSYTVTGTDGNGCVNTATSSVTVNPKPNVTVNSPSICDGSTATLNANGATTYTWSGGLPNGSSVTTPPLNSNTSYTVTGTDGNGCVNTAISNVTVNPKPTVGVNSPSICSGSIATLTATGATTYTWSGGLPNGSTVTTPVLTSSTIYSVTGTDGNGCKATITSDVTVNPLPNVTSTSPTICAGNTATLDANGATTYTWTGGLPSGNSVSTPVLNSNTNYTVTGTDGNGCKNTSTSTVFVNPTKTTNLNQTICQGQTVTIGGQTFPNTGVYNVKLASAQGCDSTVILNLTVNPQLLVDVGIAPSQNNICKGSSVTFTASPTNGGTTPQYQWYLNGSPVGTNSTTYTNTALNDSDKVWVQLVSSETCIKVNPAVSPTVDMKVNSIDYTKPTIEYCAGESDVIDLNIPQTTYTIIWKNGSTTTTTTNSDQLDVSNTTSGNVSFTIQYGNNCTANDVVPVTVNPTPQIALSVDHTIVKYGEQVQLDANGVKPYSYNWTTAGQLSNDTIEDPTSIITTPTWFTVDAVDSKGCRRIDSIFVGMKDECSNNFVMIPNAFTPNKDGLNDCFGVLYAPTMTEFKLVVFDRWGERLFETSDPGECWDGTYKGVDALMDTYTYVIGFRCYNGVFITKKGILTLVR